MYLLIDTKQVVADTVCCRVPVRRVAIRAGADVAPRPGTALRSDALRPLRVRPGEFRTLITQRYVKHGRKDLSGWGRKEFR